MDLQAEKEFIKRELDKVDDIHLVEAIKNMLTYGRVKKYEQSLHPMSKEFFYMRNEPSLAQVFALDLWVAGLVPTFISDCL
jgi:hypothetical protein